MIIKTAERIKELREKHNLTQSDLAKLLYITRSSVNAWEMAISTPSTEKIVQLCEILHTTADYLIGTNDTESIPLGKYSLEQKEVVYKLLRLFDNNTN